MLCAKSEMPASGLHVYCIPYSEQQMSLFNSQHFSLGEKAPQATLFAYGKSGLRHHLDVKSV